MPEQPGRDSPDRKQPANVPTVHEHPGGNAKVQRLCGSPGCACRRLAPFGWHLADPGEIAVDCPQRFARSIGLSDIQRLLARQPATLTARAALLLAPHPRDNPLEFLARQIAAGRLVLLDVRTRPPLIAPVLNRPPAPPPVQPSGAPETSTAWIRFKVVHHLTGEPYLGVRLSVRTPTGGEYEYRTGKDGVIDIQEIRPGTCDVWCELDRPRLKDTVAFVGLGEAGGTGVPPVSGGPAVSPEAGGTGVSPATGGTGVSPVPTGPDNAPELQNPRSNPVPRRPIGDWGQRATWIAHVLEHRVQTGETLASIAAAHDLTWQELAEFNWGTSSPDRINQHLRDDVGCTRKTPDGFNYVFTSADEPGLIYVPKPWQQTSLPTGRTHTIRVRVAAGLRLILENQDDLRIPEAEYEATLADGTVHKGRLGRSGISLIKDPPPGPVEVLYPDLDDIEAKSLAACARRAMDDRDLAEVFRVLKHSRAMIHETIRMYDTYFNDYTGNGLLADIDHEATDPDDRAALEALLRIAALHPEPGDNPQSAAPTEAE